MTPAPALDLTTSLRGDFAGGRRTSTGRVCRGHWGVNDKKQHRWTRIPPPPREVKTQSPLPPPPPVRPNRTRRWAHVCTKKNTSHVTQPFFGPLELCTRAIKCTITWNATVQCRPPSLRYKRQRMRRNDIEPHARLATSITLNLHGTMHLSQPTAVAPVEPLGSRHSGLAAFSCCTHPHLASMVKHSLHPVMHCNHAAEKIYPCFWDCHVDPKC